MVFAYMRFIAGDVTPAILNHLNVNAAAAPAGLRFGYVVPERTLFHLVRINHVIAGNTPSNNKFGNVDGPLTNGCLYDIRKADGDEVLLDLADGEPLRQNYDFLALAGTEMQMRPDSPNGAPGMPPTGLEVVTVRHDIIESGKQAILYEGESVCMVIRDDLTALDNYICMVQGYLYPN